MNGLNFFEETHGYPGAECNISFPVDSAAVRRWQEMKQMTKAYPQNGGYRNDQVQ